MVGEIRDSETAGIALQAPLTGHQVFSTHTNDAVDSVVRLVRPGVEPWVVANASPRDPLQRPRTHGASVLPRELRARGAALRR